MGHVRENEYGGTVNVLHRKCAMIRFMEATNITIKIESGLARDARVLAARRGTSLSRLVSEQLKQLLLEEQAYAVAKQDALRCLESGIDLEWEKPANRDELHAREDLR